MEGYEIAGGLDAPRFFLFCEDPPAISLSSPPLPTPPPLLLLISPTARLDPIPLVFVSSTSACTDEDDDDDDELEGGKGGGKGGLINGGGNPGSAYVFIGTASMPGGGNIAIEPSSLLV